MTDRPSLFLPSPASPGDRGAGLARLFLFLVIALRIAPANAVEWSITPSLGIREELNNNLRMVPEAHPWVWADTLSPRLRFGAATERLELRTDLGAAFSRYLGEEELDSNDLSLGGSAQYQMERSRGGVDGSFLRDSSWRSELRESGLVLAARRRRARSGGAFWEESLTERLSIRSRYEISDVRYAGEGGGLFDYQTQSGSVDLSHELSERDKVTAGVHLLGYRAPSARIRSLEAGGRVGATHLFSETLKVNASIGGRGVTTRLSFPGLEITGHERGGVGDLTIEKGFESARWRGGAGRRVDPSGSGSLIHVDHLFTVFEQEVSPTAMISLAADGYRRRAIRTGLPAAESRSFMIEPAWRWKWTEQWSMAVSYRYARQREKGGAAADAHAITWTLNYEGLKWAGSIEPVSPPD